MGSNPREYLSKPDNMPPKGADCKVDAKGEKNLAEPGKSSPDKADSSNVSDSIAVKESGRME